MYVGCRPMTVEQIIDYCKAKRHSEIRRGQGIIIDLFDTPKQKQWVL